MSKEELLVIKYVIQSLSKHLERYESTTDRARIALKVAQEQLSVEGGPNEKDLEYLGL